MDGAPHVHIVSPDGYALRRGKQKHVGKATGSSLETAMHVSDLTQFKLIPMLKSADVGSDDDGRYGLQTVYDMKEGVYYLQDDHGNYLSAKGGEIFGTLNRTWTERWHVRPRWYGDDFVVEIESSTTQHVNPRCLTYNPKRPGAPILQKTSTHKQKWILLDAGTGDNKVY